MVKSAPHIYLSALPFAPTCSLVSTHFSTTFHRFLHVECGQLSHWSSSEMTISNFGARVLSVAFLPDGCRRIVSGLDDRTIRVWDATTGVRVTDPFTGHTGWVNFVAFSPDGQYIVSGSSDQTIRVWNSTTGETAAGPFTGHTDFGLLCGILARRPARRLRFRRWNNSCVEFHDGRVGGRPFH